MLRGVAVADTDRLLAVAADNNFAVVPPRGMDHLRIGHVVGHLWQELEDRPADPFRGGEQPDR